MKRALLFISVLLISHVALSQDFDKGLEKLAERIADRINTKDGKKVAIWGFTDENSKTTSLGNFLTEDFAVYITNLGKTYQVIDRQSLDVILKEHKLNSEGYIDSKTAKELGKIIAVDVILTGTYTVVGSKIKIRVKALDSETALQFGAAIASLEINEDVSSYLGISVNGTANSNNGFNKPINSNETYNNPETVNQDCSRNKTGDFCFYNSTSKKVVLFTFLPRYRKNTGTGTSRKRIDLNIAKQKIYINSGETKCLYDLPNEVMDYYIVDFDVFNSAPLKQDQNNIIVRTRYHSYFRDIGKLNVEMCKSKTFTIK